MPSLGHGASTSPCLGFCLPAAPHVRQIWLHARGSASSGPDHNHPEIQGSIDEQPGVQGINIFLSGFVPTENLRFRDEALTFKVAETGDETEVGAKKFSRFQYPAMSKTQVRSRSLSLSQALATSQTYGTSQKSAQWLKQATKASAGAK